MRHDRQVIARGSVAIFVSILSMGILSVLLADHRRPSPPWSLRATPRGCRTQERCERPTLRDPSENPVAKLDSIPSRYFKAGVPNGQPYAATSDSTTTGSTGTVIPMVMPPTGSTGSTGGTIAGVTTTTTDTIFTLVSPGPPLPFGFGGAFVVPVGGSTFLLLFDPARSVGTKVDVTLGDGISFVPSGAPGFPSTTKAFFTDTNGSVTVPFFGFKASPMIGATTVTVSSSFVSGMLGGTVFTVTKPTYLPIPPTPLTSSTPITFTDVTTPDAPPGTSPPGFEFLVNWIFQRVDSKPFALTRPLTPYANGVATVEFGSGGTYSIGAHIVGTDPGLYSQTVTVTITSMFTFVLEDADAGPNGIEGVTGQQASGLDLDSIDCILYVGGTPETGAPVPISHSTLLSIGSITPSGPVPDRPNHVEVSFDPSMLGITLDPSLNTLLVHARDQAGNSLDASNTTLAYDGSGNPIVSTTSTGAK